MSLTNELKELIEAFDLIKRAENGLKSVLDKNTKDHLDLNEKDILENELDSFSLIVKQDGINILRVRLTLCRMNDLVGYYDYETDLNGVFHDEYFVIK